MLLHVLLRDSAGGPPLLEPKLQISFTWTLFYTVKHDTKQLNTRINNSDNTGKKKKASYVW